MRQAGLRELSKSDLIRVAEQSVREAHAAKVLYARLGARWWSTLAAASAVSCMAGLLIAWLALR